MAKCTFSATPIIWIAIHGESRGAYRTRDDGGLVTEFLEWTLKEKIRYVPMTGGTTGGGIVLCGYHPDVAERVVQWLKDHNVEQTSLEQQP